MRRKVMMRRLLWRLTVLAAAFAACAGSASAQTTNCVNGLHLGTYAVPANTSCNLTGSSYTITDNLTVESGASLQNLPNSAPPTSLIVINGSLIDVRATLVALSPVGPTGRISVANVHLTGTFQKGLEELSIVGTVVIKDSTGPVEVVSNTVGRSMLVRGKTTNAVFRIGDDVIGGSLVCQGNTPAPIDDGELNTVGGNKIGQCAGL
jgi:hypothetical protein